MSARPWQWTVFAVWCAQILSIVGFSFVMPFMAFYIRELGVSTEAEVARWTGITIASSGLTFTFFAPLWGRLADRYGRKLMVMRSMFGAAIVLTLMGVVTQVWQLLALRIVQGVLTGTVVACTTMVSSVTPREKLGRTLGLIQVAVLIGNSFGPWLGGMAADHFGLRVPFFLAGGFEFAGGLIVLLFAYERFVPVAPGKAQNHGLKQAFGGGGLIALLSVFFFVNFALSFVGPIFPLFVEMIASNLKAATTTGQIMLWTGLASGLGALAAGRLSERVSPKRWLIAATLVGGLVSFPMAAVRSVQPLFGLSVLRGLAMGGTAPTLNTIIGTSVSPDMYGRVFGLTSAVSSVGWALGPLSGGYVTGFLGLRWPFAVMGALLLASSALVWQCVGQRRPPTIAS